MTKTLDNLEGETLSGELYHRHSHSGENCPWLRLTLARKEHGTYIVCYLMYFFPYLYHYSSLCISTVCSVTLVRWVFPGKKIYLQTNKVLRRPQNIWTLTENEKTTVFLINLESRIKGRWYVENFGGDNVR